MAARVQDLYRIEARSEQSGAAIIGAPVLTCPC